MKNKHKTLIAALAMQGIMLDSGLPDGFAGYVKMGLSPIF